MSQMAHKQAFTGADEKLGRPLGEDGHKELRAAHCWATQLRSPASTGRSRQRARCLQ
jgi:hypothetical protein